MSSDGTFVSLSGSAGGPLMKMVIPPCGWRSAADEIGYCNFLPNALAGTCDLTAHQRDRLARIKRNIMRGSEAKDKDRAPLRRWMFKERGRGGEGRAWW